MRGRALFFLLRSAIVASVAGTAPLASAGTRAETEVAESRMSLSEQGKAWLTPSIAFQHLSLSETSPGQHSGSGLEFGLKFITASNQAQTLLLGLDLRQSVIRPFEILATRAGVRAEWRPISLPKPALDFALGFSWYFGDTLVIRSSDKQFNGNSYALALSAGAGAVRIFTELSWGTYREGAGFIYLPKGLGEERLERRALTAGVELPFEISL